ncbi:QsdR family transcriptional regulator [Kineosporia sp. A_224]|uniref:QsdR family transcriptional regulator n=1 Tax=Kineosporia sp. A_224 TaxID=1962180 RepID=UPI0018EA0958|nr:QsdR family transcriptional regulator [Kineosporia sp. A_224]
MTARPPEDLPQERPLQGRPAAPRPRGGRGAAAVHAAARAAYLRGDSLDMSALAAELGVGRATLYRWAGNREDLLGAVLSDATEWTFRAAVRDVDARRPGPTGGDRVLAVLDAFMHRVVDAEPLRALTAREPRLFVRLATSPGLIESRSAALLRALLDEEVAAGRMAPLLPVPVLAQAIVRIGDGPLYAHLLGGGEPRIDEALAVAAVLLGLPPGDLGPIDTPRTR